MDDLLRVRRFEGVGDLSRDGQRVGERQPAPGREPIGQRRTVDQLHDERRRRRGVLQPVDVRDVRVIECREDLRFSPEACKAFRIARDRRGQHFQRDVAVELGVARPVDLAHTPDADGADDLIRTESGTC